MSSLSKRTIELLGKYDTPTISNAIEAFGIRRKNEGFMEPEIESVFPDMGIVVGFACTAKIIASKPRGGTCHEISLVDYWKSVLSIPAPRVMVIQDLDHPNVIGSYWGEVQANIHKVLGCVGVVTNGGVRDLDEIRKLNFNVFSPHILISHAYVHLTEINAKVKVGGLDVSPGELIHADKHGVLKIPKEIAERLPAHAANVLRTERKFIRKCKSFDGDLIKLQRDFDKMRHERDNLRVNQQQKPSGQS
ncbi:RraA family protein [Candidatus Bathyarchaeota archaeon]|nr:RraA family protein [Candidatus Bathyarchaeota archaeon]